MAEQITNIGQAINILIQVANIAQSKGVLTLAEAVVVKESIDFINKLQEQSTAESTTSSNAPMGGAEEAKTKANKTK